MNEEFRCHHSSFIASHSWRNSPSSRVAGDGRGAPFPAILLSGDTSSEVGGLQVGFTQRNKRYVVLMSLVGVTSGEHRGA